MKIEGEYYGLMRIPVLGDNGVRLIAKLERMARLRGERGYEALVKGIYESVEMMDVNKAGITDREEIKV